MAHTIIYLDWGRSSAISLKLSPVFCINIIIIIGDSENYVFAEAFLKAFIKKLLGSALNDYGGPEGS